MGRARGKSATALLSAPARRGRGAVRAAELALPELRSSQSVLLVRAAELHDWDGVADGLAAHQYLTEPAQEARSQVLSALAHHLTPEYRVRWNKEVGLFVSELYGTSPEISAEHALGAAVWPEGYAAVAERLGFLNLEDSAGAGHILSVGFIKELCSVGWRNTFLSQLRRQGEGDFAGLMERVTRRDPRLRQRLAAAESAAGRLTWDLWFDLWQAHRQAARKRQPVNLPELLVARLTD